MTTRLASLAPGAAGRGPRRRTCTRRGAQPAVRLVRQPFAYAAAELLGAPAFLALRRLGLLPALPMLAAGAAVGAVSGPLAWAALALAVELNPWDPSYIEPGALGGLGAAPTLWLVDRP